MKKLLIIPLLLAGCVEHEPQFRDPLICEYPVIVEDEIVFRPILDPGCFRDDRDDRARAEPERQPERHTEPEKEPETDKETDREEEREEEHEEEREEEREEGY